MLSWIKRVKYMILPQIFEPYNANQGVKTCKLTFYSVKQLCGAAEARFFLTVGRFINLFGLI